MQLNMKVQWCVLCLMLSGVSCNTELPSFLQELPVVEYDSAGNRSKSCGWRQEDGISNRIAVPDSASSRPNYGEFPWITAVLKYNTSSNQYQYHCAGSLVHPRAVLSVAHYFIGTGSYQVRVGDWDISQETEIIKDQRSEVQSIQRHARYRLRTFAYDIAVLILSTAINEAPNVGYACLPPSALSTPAGTRCIVAGWGFEKFEGGRVQNILRVVEVPVVEHGDCRRRLRSLSSLFRLHSSMMCAGGEPNRDACLRDGGAPLICPYEGTEGRYYQAGIVAAGHRCGKEIPSLYTDVAALRSWIDQVFVAQGINDASYYTP